jgi:uncharacterized protein YggE
MRILTILCLLLLLPAGTMADEVKRRISVTGQASVTAAPDMAMISVGVQTTGETAANAIAANSAAMQSVFTAIAGAGIDAKDVQTSQFNVSPVWQDRRKQRDGPPLIVGFQVDNQVRIKVRNVDNIGSVIDALATAGANRFNAISFQIENPEPLLDQARADAVKDARRKAELMAHAAGVELGDVIRISDAQRAPRGGGQMMEMAAMSRAAPIAQGELSLSTQAFVVFEIDD